MQQAIDFLSLRTRGTRERNVFIEEARGDDLHHREVPVIADIFVLAFGPEVRDQFLDACGLMLHLSVQSP